LLWRNVRRELGRPCRSAHSYVSLGLVLANARLVIRIVRLLRLDHVDKMGSGARPLHALLHV
jgi:hypothetical protein